MRRTVSRPAPRGAPLRRRPPRAPPPPPAASAAGRPRDRELDEFRAAEADPRYQREDMSAEHARAARAAFLRAACAPAGRADLTEAALQAGAEDDALVSHSSVVLPVGAFHARLARAASEIASDVLPPLRAERAPPPAEELAAVEAFLFGGPRPRLAPPASGRSNLPPATRVDAPGIWEDARLGYLHEALTCRRGVPAVLALALGDALRQLLASGSIAWAARVDFSRPNRAPSAEALPGAAAPGAALGMVTADALAETQAFLARAYWPFPWTSPAPGAPAAPGGAPRGGGFAAAAAAFLDGGGSAEFEAVARAARHRLERGIHTSPGGGDLRRALAAQERLVVLRTLLGSGAALPEARRDLAALYCHAGRLAEARAELRAARSSAAAPGGRGALVLGPTGASFASGPSGAADAALADRLLDALARVRLEGAADARPLDAAEAARRCAGVAPARVMPLTW
jgi:hypothetical protein